MISRAVRLAGVYAMAGLADDWPENRQTCVDVLCAYLRLPYDPDPGDDATRTERPLTGRTGRCVTPLSGSSPRISKLTRRCPGRAGTSTSRAWSSTAATSRRRLLRRQVRLTGAEFSGGWSASTGARFSGSTVASTALSSLVARSFVDGRVLRRQVFFGAEFSGGTVSFVDAEFSGGKVLQRRRVLRRQVSFIGAILRRHGRLRRRHRRLRRRRFLRRPVHFDDANFSGGTVSFGSAEFSGGRSSSAPFLRRHGQLRPRPFSGGKVNFSHAEFSGGTVDFSALATGRSHPHSPGQTRRPQA